MSSGTSLSRSEQRVAVIGAGPAGLAAAVALTRAGVKVEIFEASQQVGGLARTIDRWGYRLDLSAHIFTTNNLAVAKLWQQFCGKSIEIPLKRAIFRGADPIPYPLTPASIGRHLSTVDLLVGTTGFALNRLNPRRVPSHTDAETWMTRRYGRRFFELFFRDYAEKLWGLPSSEIDARFAQYLFNSSSSSADRQTFSHPQQGVGSVWERMANALVDAGATIHLDTPVRGLNQSKGHVQGLRVGRPASGQHHQTSRNLEFDHVISTMPLTRFAHLALGAENEAVRHTSKLQPRSAILVYIHADRAVRQGWNWVSIYPPSYQAGRLTDFGGWIMPTDDTTVHCLEYWCDHGDDRWHSSDEDLTALACDELRRSQLVGQFNTLDTHIERIPNSHPSHQLGSGAALDAISQEIDGLHGCTSIGRGGSQAVLGMGESMEAGWLSAEKVLRSASKPAPMA